MRCVRTVVPPDDDCEISSRIYQRRGRGLVLIRRITQSVARVDEVFADRRLAIACKHRAAQSVCYRLCLGGKHSGLIDYADALQMLCRIESFRGLVPKPFGKSR